MAQLWPDPMWGPPLSSERARAEHYSTTPHPQVVPMVEQPVDAIPAPVFRCRALPCRAREAPLATNRPRRAALRSSPAQTDRFQELASRRHWVLAAESLVRTAVSAPYRRPIRCVDCCRAGNSDVVSRRWAAHPCPAPLAAQERPCDKPRWDSAPAGRTASPAPGRLIHRTDIKQ
jgi:hypothetical protein